MFSACGCRPASAGQWGNREDAVAVRQSQAAGGGADQPAELHRARHRRQVSAVLYMKFVVCMFNFIACVTEQAIPADAGCEGDDPHHVPGQQYLRREVIYTDDAAL